MIVPDVDLLVYAHDENATRHDEARRWWGGLVNGAETVGMPWVVSTGFIRQMATPSVVENSWTPAEAARVVAISLADIFRS